MTDKSAPCATTKLVELEDGKRLFDMLREGNALVVRWAELFGRNYQDMTDAIHEFTSRDMAIYKRHTRPSISQ